MEYRWLDGTVIPMQMVEVDAAILQSRLVVDANTVPPIVYGGTRPSYVRVFTVAPSHLTCAQAEVYERLRADGLRAAAAAEAAIRLA